MAARRRHDANLAPTSAYGEKIRAYLNAPPKLQSPWAKPPHRQGPEVSPVAANQAAWKGSWTQRDTVALCSDFSHRRVLCGVNWVTEGKLIGRDVEPEVGMTVRLTKQGLQRRTSARPIGPTAAAWRAKENDMKRPWTGDSGGDMHRETGVITRVGSTWTCDVRWSNGQTGTGYACGGSGGKSGRAFHLQLVEDPPRPRRKVLGDAQVREMALQQLGVSCTIPKGR